MNLLAIDCASRIYSISCMKNNKVSTEYTDVQKKNTKHILYKIDKILNKTNLLLSNIDCFVFNKGPGSLLGLRISIAVMQGLSFANNSPVLGISSLHILAQRIFKYTHCKQVLIASNCNKNLINWAIYQKHNNKINILKEHFSTPQEMLSVVNKISDIWIISGDSWEKYEELKNFVKVNVHIIYIKNIFPNSQDIVQLASVFFSRKKNFLLKNFSYKKNFFNFYFN